MAFDGDVVLDSVNLVNNDKEYSHCFVPSGCGKSTTLRIIGGFVTPSPGRLL
jgi:spermidine/putrescine transport system ATP-binding protein